MSACPHWHPLANLIFCTPSQYWFYKHILCRPAPHLHLLANSLYPWPVRVLQTHLMSACPTFASPCWFFAPLAGTGSTNTSHVGLHHMCISLPIFCTPGRCGFYKHIPNRPEPHLHPLAMPAGTSSTDSWPTFVASPTSIGSSLPEDFCISIWPSMLPKIANLSACTALTVH